MTGASPPGGNARVTSPSPNPGSDAAASAEVQQAVKILQGAFSKVDPGGEAGKTIIKCITSLSKIATVSQAAPNVGMEALKQALERARQNAPIQALLQQQGGGGAMPGGGQPPPAPGGAAPAA